MNISSKFSISNTKIPLVIGVTGHRDLIEGQTEKLKMVVDGIFKELKNKCPNTPFIILSALAEGADLLVAEVGLNNGADLIVPLPLPPNEYLHDFLSEKSKDKFNELLHRSRHSFEMGLGEGTAVDNIKIPGKHRDRQYMQSGAFIAQQSHLLIALWDGEDTGLNCGTSYVVKFKLEGVPESFIPKQYILDLIENGPVYHVLTARIKNESPNGQLFSFSVIFPGNKAERIVRCKQFKSGLVKLDRFNKSVDGMTSGVQAVRDSFQNDLNSVSLPETFPDSCSITMDRYCAANYLAGQFQKKRYYSMTGIYLLVLAAFTLFNFHEYFGNSLFHMAGWGPYVFMLYPLLTLAAIALYCIAKYSDYHDCHLAYRALAEATRVQFYWQIAGIQDDVNNYYLSKHRGEITWIREAIKAWNLPPKSEDVSNESILERYRFVIDNWILGQMKYFKNNYPALEKKEKRLNFLSNTSFVLSFLSALLMAILYLHLHYTNMMIFGGFSICVLLSLAAAFDGYREKMALHEQALQYMRMSDILARGSNYLSKEISLGNCEASKELIMKLGQEALNESSDWLHMHYTRPISIPRGS
jgi:hypothetical protein